MTEKRLKGQISERILYLVTITVTPSIPLFFLYSQNATQGLLFYHFLIFGGVLALFSIILYLTISRFFLRRRRSVILLAIFWSAFWFFLPLESVINKINTDFSQGMIVVCIIAFITLVGFVLRWIHINRFVANTIAVVLCILFAFNFTPEVYTVLAREIQKAINERTGRLAYEIKTEFNIDHNLPKPNVYWLHMDGMMGFSGVEYFFGDSQNELKNDLFNLGFVINENARLGAGYTTIAVPAMTMPTFYDSFLSDEFSKVAQIPRTLRDVALSTAMAEKGFTLDDIFPHNELIKAFSDAGYVTISNQSTMLQSEYLDMQIDGWNEVTGVWETRKASIAFGKLLDFKDLISEASVLSAIKPKLDYIVEQKRPKATDIRQLPAYSDYVEKYTTGESDLDWNMALVVRAIRHSSTIQKPYFFYSADVVAHCTNVNGYEIGGVTYEDFIGNAFIYDENGNAYKERLDDPHDVNLYYPQYKYAVKHLKAMVEIIIENDPGAVIVVQADHGIHGIGPVANMSEFLYGRGYSLEDQLFLNMSTISAVRIPPQYGSLTQPLDPLDITRYLVNNFVGAGNYEYLYYEKEISE